VRSKPRGARRDVPARPPRAACQRPQRLRNALDDHGLDRVGPDRAFERNEVARRWPVRLFDEDLFVISPEGSVVSKLRWVDVVMPPHLDIMVSPAHHFPMRTTVNIDADVYRAAASLAAEKKSTLGRVLSDLARRGLAPTVRVREKDGFPVFDVPAGASPITPEMVREAEEDA
jgi:hypothetical protein